MTDITLEQRARLMFAGHLRANGYACGAEAIELGRHSPYDRAALGAIAEALEAALRLSAGADWQPIETAPTDQMILGWNKWETAVYEAKTMVIRGGPVTVWRVPGDHDDVYDSPTHWQPLPAAPRHETGEVES